MMSELKSKLPSNSQNVDINLDEFLSGADSKTVTTKKITKSVIYPWQEDRVREDVTKLYNLRLPEPYFLKLKYIANNTSDSMQTFCLNVVQKAIDAKIAKLTK